MAPSGGKSLAGKRVLVPRSKEQAAETARDLIARGAEPVLTPVLAFCPPPDRAGLERAVMTMGTYDVVGFTSANGVQAVFDVLEDKGLDAGAFGGACVAAVGPATAEALVERGVRPGIVAVESRAEGLARAILAVRPRRVLLAQALVAREALAEALRAAGVEVDVVAAYQTCPADRSLVQPVEADLFARRIDAVLFTSSSTVTHLVQALGERALDLLSETTIACIGPVTAETARERGLRVDVTAEKYTMAGLLDALERYYRCDDRRRR
jgi:uroporphyrinogen III methyltransferase / synthase